MRRIGLLLLLCLGPWPGLRAQDPLFRRLTLRDGMPSNTVYTIAQDKDGFLWFGTDAGAVRYDGSNFDVYDVERGLSDDQVFVLESDAEGRVWFLPGNGRPCYMDQRGLHSWRNDSVLARVHLPSGIRSMALDRNGTRWFGGLRGELVRWTADGRVVSKALADPITGVVGGHITAALDSTGDPLVFSTCDLMDPFTGRELRIGPRPMGLSVTRRFPNGRILSTSTGQVHEWIAGEWRMLLDSTILPEEPSFFQTYPMGPGELWVTLRSGGMLWLRHDGTTWRPVRDVLFPGDLINNVLLGREGNIWLCTDYGGVIMFSALSASTSYFRGVRGTREEFTCAHTTADGAVWCGTNQGDLYRLGERFELVDLPPKGDLFVRVNRITSQWPYLWVCTGASVFRLDLRQNPPTAEEVVSTHDNWSGPRPSGMKSLTIAPDGTVVGTMYGAYLAPPGSVAFKSLLDPGIPNLRIYAPHFDRHGTLWFEVENKLFSRTPAGIRAHPEVQLPPGARITDITGLGDTLFISTFGQGVLVLAGDRMIKRLTTADGLPSDKVLRLSISDGDLFVACANGASRIIGPWDRPHGLDYITSVGGAQFAVRDITASTDHAYVLFANGLCRLPRARNTSDPQVPLPYIRTVLVNDSVHLDHTIVGIRQGRDLLQIELGAVHFTMPERVRLEYRLDPDGEWQRAVGRTLDLSTLAAGDHHLEVRAQLDGGPWSTPIAMSLVVVPPLWSRWWAIALLAVLAAGLVFMVLRGIAYRRYRRKEERVRQRELLATERQRLAMDLHDDLGAELSSLLLLTRMERERPAPGGLERIEQLAGKLTDKVKEVIWSTDPGHDTLEGTLTFIQRHVTTLCQRHGKRTRMAIDPLMPAVEIPTTTRQELYLIAKEALNNTIKHAQATTVTFGASFDQGTLTLVLSDDGVGGTTRVRNTGNGLRNMQGRATAIGAVLAITEVDPHGTRITLKLPLTGSPNG